MFKIVFAQSLLPLFLTSCTSFAVQVPLPSQSSEETPSVTKNPNVPRWASLEMPPVKETLFKEMRFNRKKWRANAIESYKITLENENCYCLYGPYYGPNHISVRQNKLISVIYRGEHRDGFARGDELMEKSALKQTIEEIFTNLERTILWANENTVLNIEYDSAYGFPTLIDYDRINYGDAQSKLIVSDFKPLK